MTIPQKMTIEMLINNNLLDKAKAKLKEWGYENWDIADGKLIDKSNLTEHFLEKFITCDSDMLSLKDDIRKLSVENDEILIIGPTGTGKELIARALHGNRAGKYQAINCAGIPITLMESILFGHVQGAFTGALRSRDGLMRSAANGTLFLDEIGEMPMELQSKLLRAIQERVICPVGGEKDHEISCRIVCATNKNLFSNILFREDLLARISTFILYTKGLHDRIADIELIIRSLDGGKEFLEANREPISKLPVPFNVRSLQQHVRRYKVLGRL